MCITNIKNSKHTRVWIQDICKKSTVLAKKYWEHTLLSINIVIDDRLILDFLTVLPLDEKIIVDLIYCNL